MKDSAGEASNLVIGDACWNAMLFVWSCSVCRLRSTEETTDLSLESLQQSSASYGSVCDASKRPVPSMAVIHHLTWQAAINTNESAWGGYCV